MIARILIWSQTRPTADDILGHLFFQSFGDNIIERSEERNYQDDPDEGRGQYATVIESNRDLVFYRDRIIEIIDNPPQFE